jgi:uncharacterized protein YcbK (DUF882 family)
MNIHRKSGLSVLALLTLASGVTALQLSDARGSDARSLSFYHTHTGKRLDVVYFEDGDYVQSGMDEINDFLLDFRTGDIAEMDPKLMDILYDLRAKVGRDEVYEVISAYRSPQTNEMLRSRSGGVARQSQHLLGNAIDVRLRGVAIEDLRDTALAMQRGGVGFYKSSDFVHLDTGRVRRW